MQRALALFLVTYCLVASFTETGLSDASAYLLELALAASLLVPPTRGPEAGMRILLVHNRYRSATPSGENRVVDQEAEALGRAGHEVMRFGRSSDEIEHWSRAKKASLPARVVWSRETHRDLAATLREHRPDVVHVHNTFPLLSAAVLYACRDAAVPVVATMHNYRLACASGDFFRHGAVCHDCAGRPARPGGAARLLPGVARGHRAGGPGHERAPAGVAVAGVRLRVHLGGAARPARGPRPAQDRVFVRHNLIPRRRRCQRRRGSRSWSTPAGWTRPRACAC